MILSKEQSEQLLRKLNELWKSPQECQVCHHYDWSLSNVVFELREFNHGSIVVGGGGGANLYPAIPATCRTCGNTIFFNAIVLGVVDAPQPQKEVEKP
jgi:hypothetical protein